MARAITWAVRVKMKGAPEAFGRVGFVLGSGPIVNYYTKEHAELAAELWRDKLTADDVVIVIERSHGRQSGKQP